jgi:hypothetical protein
MRIDTLGIFNVLQSYKANGFNSAMVAKQLEANGYNAQEIKIGLQVFSTIPEPESKSEGSKFGESVISVEPVSKWERFIDNNLDHLPSIWFSSIVIGFFILALINKGPR